MTKTFEIMFDDLTGEAQQRFLEFQELESAADGNYDVFAIACTDVETDAIKED